MDSKIVYDELYAVHQDTLESIRGFVQELNLTLDIWLKEGVQ